MQSFSGVCRTLGAAIMEKAKGSLYAVQVGRKTGIFRTWAECEKQVKGFSGAKFKKFSSQSEARNFVLGKCIASTDSISKQPSSGSFIKSSRKRSSEAAGCSSLPKNSKRFCQTKLIDPQPLSGGSGSSDDQLQVVYSDGSCTKNGRIGAQAGIGVYWRPGDERNISERLEGNQTNQRAEIVAAAVALESAKKSGLKSVEIRTDSMYTINGINSWIKGWKRNGWKTANGKDVQNKEDFQRLDRICQELQVKWTHVPGHSGFHGNEAADSLAQQGANKPQVNSS